MLRVSQRLCRACPRRDSRYYVHRRESVAMADAAANGPRKLLRTLPEKVDPQHTALIVVDVQNDFCHEASAYAQMGHNVAFIQEMIPRLAATIEAARNARVPVIFLRIVQSPDTNSDAWEALESDDGPRLVVEGT